ncbi:MAG: riboflavin synthase [Nitriliruptorales bacterium]|nr:riboflavin synthase [Nitriliruptorales bacterium]
MFTGIVEEIGTVRGIRRNQGSAVLTIDCHVVTEDARVGDSINVNGCCLTVTTLSEAGGFTADLMGETLDRTSLGSLGSGAGVNLERALRADGRLGGHIVQGHVDGVGTITLLEPREEWTIMQVAAPQHLRRYIVEKGSITVDGTSLTVMEADGDRFTVGLIPHTMAATSLRERAAGDRVNLEVDVIAKYVENMLRPRSEELS